MKRTLLAAALFSACAAVYAADVQIYGMLDLGLGYTNTDTGIGDSTTKFDMRSGQNTGSRVGLRGSEQISEDLKVGFVLESGLTLDNGELDNAGRLFGRESNLYLQGKFGTLSFGRVGELVSGLGSYGLFGGAVSAFGTGWSDIPGHKYVLAGNFLRFDNMVTYKSPNIAGFEIYGQYTFGGDKKTYKDPLDSSITAEGKEGKSSVDRYWALGATYKAQGIYLVGVVDSYNYASWNPLLDTGIDVDDSFRVSLGGRYDFSFGQLLAAAQYFRDIKTAISAVNTTNSGFTSSTPVDGFGLNVSGIFPAFGGRIKTSVGYMDAEKSNDASIDLKRYAAAVGFEYPLSKRTFAYVGVGTYFDEYGADGSNDAHVYSASSGLVHNF